MEKKMSLNDAIRHLEESIPRMKSDESVCDECVGEHVQLLSWLKELKDRRTDKKATWKQGGKFRSDEYTCSNCGHIRCAASVWGHSETSFELYKFCPSCGRKMTNPGYHRIDVDWGFD